MSEASKRGRGGGSYKFERADKKMSIEINAT